MTPFDNTSSVAGELPTIGMPAIYTFENFEVRIVERDGEPWFVLIDVCAVLDHSNPSMAAGRLDDDEKGVSTVYTPGGPQEVIVINESGLYSLILTSRKEAAKRFKKWITAEVIPSIRKTGSYSLKALTPAEALLGQVKLMVAMERRQVELEAKQKQQDAAIEEATDRLHQIETASDHFTCVGYARWVRGESIDYQRAAELGRRASRRARDLGVRLTKIPDPRFGAVSQYPKSILDFAWSECFPAPETVQ